MAESQIQFKCPVCREETPFFDEPIRCYPGFPVFACQRIHFYMEQEDTPSRSIEKSKKKIAREINEKTKEFEEMVARFSAMAAGFSKTVIDFRETETEETERNKLAEIKAEYDTVVQKTITLEQNEAKLLNSIAALTRMYNEKEKK